ncbi:MAG: ATP-grasp domain-containing protein [Deltaproteobacteria bacterium]|nr:ATP-grasp domain-containing protein [Deltaproteobacteria bacterium]
MSARLETKRPFERICIVNRGEPALRLIHAVRERVSEGAKYKTIALFTAADRSSSWVREADERYELPLSGARAYLDYPSLMAALRETRAEAVWVGWGFVSEHSAFAEACEQAGIVFIGPKASAMRALGDKIASKLLAEKACVPVAAWSGGPCATIEEATKHAERVGYPLVVKATAGGGGRGIRRVADASALAEAYASAKSEAKKAFGDDTVYLEKQISAARHIEIQMLADRHGTHWAAGLRDCTLQRRAQKVIEEGPAASLPKKIGDEMRAAAVRLSQAAGYENAGTVEFLYEPKDDSFYFMEMNTRLQVEHPVTEATTGLDLVKWQLRIAHGEALPKEPPVTHGHAIEARLCAEDPDADFAPAPGKIAHLVWPSGPGIRVDSGFSVGDAVSDAFDSMIAKIIAVGSTREEALARLVRALEQTAITIDGGSSNRAFLLALLGHDDVRRDKTHVRWIDEHQAVIQERPHAALALAVAAITAHERAMRERAQAFVASAARGRLAAATSTSTKVTLGYEGTSYTLKVEERAPGELAIDAGNGAFVVEYTRRDAYTATLTSEGADYKTLVSERGGALLVDVGSGRYKIELSGAGTVRAPMPAVLVALRVRVGDIVNVGDQVATLEAMKTELPLRASAAGKVKAIFAAAGSQLAQGAPLIELEAVGSAEAKAGPRVEFPKEKSAAMGGTPQQIAALMHAVLGYDSSAKSDAALPADENDTAALRAREQLMQALTDVLSLFSEPREAGTGNDHSHPQAFGDYLLAYLRAVDARALPEPFVKALEAALSHYGLRLDAARPEIEAALVRMHRGVSRLADHTDAILSLLGDDWPTLPRALSQRLVDVTHDAHRAINDAARRGHFVAFDEPLFQATQAEQRAALVAEVGKANALPPGQARAAIVEQLTHSAHPILSVLGDWFYGKDAAFACELYLRRFYTRWDLKDVTSAQASGVHVARGVIGSKRGPSRAIVAWIGASPLDKAIQALQPLLAERADRTVLDVVVDGSKSLLGAEEWRAAFDALLAKMTLPPQVVRVCFTTIGEHTRYDTYARDEQGRFAEQIVHRSLHPMMSGRLETWRLRDFHIERLDAPSEVFLYRIRAKDNPKDERLSAFASVRDLTAGEGPDGLSLPYLEHTVLNALTAMRDRLADDPARAPRWNRLIVFCWEPVTLSNDALQKVFARLGRGTRDLDLEKIVLRADRLDASGRRVPFALHLALDGGILVRARESAVSDEPIRTLTPYKQKVARLRKRGLSYPYDIVRLLTPAQASGGISPGRFKELDLDATGKLAFVDRPYGENTANLVVGEITNTTADHPNGIRRVIILSDPSKDMGALAEPECRRVIAAIDRAEQERVSLEWFPVSSGAAISMNSGTENLDWTARALRRIIEFTERGGEINVVVNGVSVGAQSYWNAEATMLMHTKGVLIMTDEGAMVLTGKRALDYSGSVSAEDHQGIGGARRIMGPNGEAQFIVRDISEACATLLAYYDITHVPPTAKRAAKKKTSDPKDRDPMLMPYEGEGFQTVGDVFDNKANPSRKKPFAIRRVLRAVIDQDRAPLERFRPMREAETAVVWEAHIGGYPVTLLGIESQPVPRVDFVPADGPDQFSGGTLFPLSSKKVARALNAASGRRPVVVLANLSGFDGSPESMRKLQLEYGAEIGRAVVKFDGPIVFCVISRYHGGAYVVFSQALNDRLEASALEGSHASVIGGAPAAAVVFSAEVKTRTLNDARVKRLQQALDSKKGSERAAVQSRLSEVSKRVHAEKTTELAGEFDRIHSVERAKQVGSISHIVAAKTLRAHVIDALERGLR